MSVLRGAALYAAGNLMSKVLFFFIVPIVSAKLGTEQYGIFSSVETLFSLLPAVMTLSIENGIFRIYYDYNDHLSRKQYLGTICMFSACLALVSSVAMALIPNITQWIFPQIDFNPYFILAIAISLLNSLLAAPKVILQVEEKALSFSLLTIVQALTTIVLVMLIVIKFNGGALGYLKAVFWANAVAVCYSYFLIWNSVSWRFGFNGLLSSLKFSFPLLPGILFAWVLNASDRAIMGRHISNELIGIYSLGWKYATLTTLATSSISTALAPSFYKIMNSGDLKAKENVSKLLEISMLVVIAVSFINSVIGADAVRYFAKREFSEASTIVMILCGASAISSLGISINLQFYQMKKSYIPVVFVMCAGVVSVVLNSFVVPILGIYAPPLTLIAVNLLMFFAPYFFAQKLCPIPFKWFRVVPFMLLLVAIRFWGYFFASGIAVIAVNYSAILLVALGGVFLYKREAGDALRN